MNKTIWKYPLVLTHTQTIDMPRDASVLCVQWQGRSPCIWALVDKAEPMATRYFHVVGTGNAFESADRCVYLGTVQQTGTIFVWHVFEYVPPIRHALSKGRR